MLSLMVASTVLTGAAELHAPEVTEPILEEAAYEQPLTAAERRALDGRDPRAGRWGPIVGDWELLLTGGGVSDRRFRENIYNFNFSIGHYLTDHFQLAFRQGVSFVDPGPNVSSTLRAQSRVAADWHFDFEQLQPFVGASIGYEYGDGPDTWVAGPEVGLKFFVTQQAFLLGMMEYQFFFRGARGIGDEFRHGQFVFTLGIGFLF